MPTDSGKYWEQVVLQEISKRSDLVANWVRNRGGGRTRQKDRQFHLAVFVEPFLGYILDGRKRVESRFSKRPIPPYGSVSRGDWIALKQAAGPVVGVCEVGDVWFYELDETIVEELKEKFSVALCAMDPEFWRRKASARFLTLMEIRDVHTFSPFFISKRDRRGWVRLKPVRTMPILPT